MKACPICVEEVPDSYFALCPACPSEVCFNCVRTYISTQKNAIQCMSCSATWSQAYMYRHLPKNIVYTVLKTQRAEALLEREKTLLPETQTVIRICDRKKEIADEIYDLQVQIDALKMERRMLDIQMANLRQHVTEQTEKKPTIVMGCPGDGCRGFIFSDGYACGLCKTQVCKKCHVTLGEEEHECKEEDLETIKLMKKETKPCPGCGCACMKTDGCDQVWCRNCGKAWSWQNGNIEEGVIHALDYYTYMRERNLPIQPYPHADACRENTAYRNFYNLGTDHVRDGIVTGAEWDNLYFVYRKMGEFQYIRVPEEAAFEKFRIMYLKNQLTEQKWRERIIRADKEAILRQETYNMQRAFFMTMRDLFNRYCLAKKKKEFREVMKEIFAFQRVMVSEFRALCEAFKSKRANVFGVAV